MIACSQEANPTRNIWVCGFTAHLCELSTQLALTATTSLFCPSSSASSASCCSTEISSSFLCTAVTMRDEQDQGPTPELCERMRDT